MRTKPRLLWIGDAVAHTGFATVTHSVLHHLQTKYDVIVLGVNYRGDPHQYPYPIYPCTAYRSDDVYGFSRLQSLIQTVKPDIVVILNDPWVIAQYALYIPEKRSFKVYGYTPVDAENVNPNLITPLNRLDGLAACTEFGKRELTKSGVVIPMYVIPHGIDIKLFRPTPKNQARTHLRLADDWFIVGLVNRNQFRKRLDLAFQYFAEWSRLKPPSVKLYYHGAVRDVGWDILNMAQYYGIEDRLIVTSLHLTSYQGLPEHELPMVYNSFDVQITTTLGEGWGLTTMEGMACGVPQIVPRWSALGEWCEGAVHYVPCTATEMHIGGINTVGGVADKQLFMEALEKVYTDKAYRNELSAKGLELVRKPEYRWSSVASLFTRMFKEVPVCASSTQET